MSSTLKKAMNALISFYSAINRRFTSDPECYLPCVHLKDFWLDCGSRFRIFTFTSFNCSPGWKRGRMSRWAQGGFDSPIPSFGIQLERRSKPDANEQRNSGTFTRRCFTSSVSVEYGNSLNWEPSYKVELLSDTGQQHTVYLPNVHHFFFVLLIHKSRKRGWCGPIIKIAQFENEN